LGVTQAKAMIEAGKLKTIAVTGDKCIDALPKGADVRRAGAEG